VEELNGEGFPYSPYLLRRPQLLTPAAMAAAPPAATPGAAAASRRVEPAEPPAPAPAGPTRDSIDQAVAASVAAAHAAAAQQGATRAGGPTVAVSRPAAPPAASWPAAVPPAGVSTTSPVQGGPPPAPGAPPAPPAPAPAPATGTGGASAGDTVAVDGPAAPPLDAGIGGLFGGGEPADDPAPPRTALPRTAVLPAQTGVAGPAQPVVGGAPTAPPAQTFWDRPPGDDAGEDDAGSRRPRRTRRMLLLLAALLVAVLAVVGAGVVLAGREDGTDTAAPEQPPEQPGASGPALGTVQEIGGVAYTLRAAQLDQTCVGHAYGDTAGFFGASDCTGLSRALYSAQLGGRDVVVSVARVRMPDTNAARALRDTTDRNGSGNVSDLLREGVRYPGAPEQLRSAEYASAVSGTTVTVVESAWVDPRGGGTEAEVDQVATDGLALPTPAIPG
jgi:hypothetical protein